MIRHYTQGQSEPDPHHLQNQFSHIIPFSYLLLETWIPELKKKNSKRNI